MTKQMKSLLYLFVCLCVIVSSSAFAFAADVISATDSPIAWLMKLYGFALSDDIVSAMQASFSPQTFDCGPIRVTLREVLYDGVWLYTSATVTPVNPAAMLIMPGSASLDDFVSGGYQENLRDDQRSFQQAASQDKKKLIRVTLHPAELEQAEYFFLDHRQDAGNQSTIFSGAPINGTEETLTIHLSIKLDSVAPSSEEYTQSNSYEFPVDIQRIGSVNRRAYHSMNDKAPFTLIYLVETPLTIYAFPVWNNEDAENRYQFRLLDKDSDPVGRGAPPDGSTYGFTEFPDAFSVMLMEDDIAQGEPIYFSSVNAQE